MVRGALGSSWILVAAVTILCGVVSAEGAAGATVSGDGEATVKLKPTILRLRVQFLCDDKTASAALDKLMDRCKTAIKKIKSLSPTAGSIALCVPSVAEALSCPPGYSTPSSPYPPATATVAGTPAQKVCAVATISADWPLEAEGPALVLARESLKTKVRDADLARGDDTVTMAPEVYYIAKVSRSQREAAIADAFAEAKAHATELAAGIGSQRGPLIELSPKISGFSPYYATQYAGIGYSEASATDGNSCCLQVCLTAKFRLVEKEK